jgi:hypothetical protein
MHRRFKREMEAQAIFLIRLSIAHPANGSLSFVCIPKAGLTENGNFRVLSANGKWK